MKKSMCLKSVFYKFIFVLIFGLASASMGSVIAQAVEKEGSTIDFSTIKSQEISKIFETASTSKKPVILIFDAVWCSFCKAFETETLVNNKVIKTLEKFEKINVDVDENEADATTFNGKPKSSGGNGIPAIIIFSSDGKELERINGFIDATDFNEILKRALKKIKPIS
jgi:thiol:disulfide interchange protein